MEHVLKWLFLGVVFLQETMSAVSKDEKNEFVQIHNDFRSDVSPTATNMKTMVSMILDFLTNLKNIENIKDNVLYHYMYILQINN